MYSCVFFKIRPKYVQLTKVFIILYKLNVYLMNMTSLLKNPILLCSNSLNKMLHLVQYYLHDKMFHILVWYQLSWKCYLYPNQLTPFHSMFSNFKHRRRPIAFIKIHVHLKFQKEKTLYSFNANNWINLVKMSSVSLPSI